VFPYNRVKVSVLAVTRDERAQLEAVLDGEPSLADRMAERLISAGCDPAGVDARTVYVAAPGEEWRDRAFHVELVRLSDRAPSPRPPRERPPTLELTVEHGKAERETYTFSAMPVHLGRCADLRDSRHRLIRANHVAFIDAGAEANASVSRRHARIVYDPATGHYRVCDDRSAHGTGILRDGRIIGVPPGARGIRIRSGDVIVLGEARVRVTWP
jgi:hypothetical protein